MRILSSSGAAKLPCEAAYNTWANMPHIGKYLLLSQLKSLDLIPHMHSE